MQLGRGPLSSSWVRASAVALCSGEEEGLVWRALAWAALLQAGMDCVVVLASMSLVIESLPVRRGAGANLSRVEGGAGRRDVGYRAIEAWRLCGEGAEV